MPYTANATNIIHEAHSGMFEAHVTVESALGTTCHVVHVPGPISMPFEALRPALIRSAIDQHKKGQFVSRVVPADSPGVLAYRNLFSAPSLLDKFFGRAA